MSNKGIDMSGTPMAGFTATSPYILKAAACGEVGTERGTYGCPKLDSVDYSEKLTEIIRENDIKSVTVVRMEVPCCGGLEMAAKKALQQSGKFIPWQVVTVTVDGRLVDE